MGFRARKSINLGGGVKLNINKKSVGISAGNKLGRVSVNSNGRKTTTIHTPVKGVSYVHTESGKKSSSSSDVYIAPKKEMKTGTGMLITTVLFGWLGIHRFASGQIGMGLLYLCTLGLFGIGWIHDIVVQVKSLQGTDEEHQNP